MSKTSSASQVADLARATLKRLVELRLAPTPDNYARVFAELEGRADSIPSGAGAEQATATAMARQTTTASSPQTQTVAWGTLLLNLLGEWERSQSGLTQLQKRQSIEALGPPSAPAPDAAELQQRLERLLAQWSAMPNRQAAGAQSNTSGTPVTATADAIWRQLWSQSLKYGLLSSFHDDEVRQRVQALIDVAEGRQDEEASDPSVLSAQSRELWRLWDSKHADEQAVRDGLIRLFDLILGNLGEFLAQDHWISVQMSAIQDTLRPPLDVRRLEEAQGNLKQLLFRQGVLHKSADEARATAKELIGLVVRNLAAYAEHSASYNQSLEADLKKLEVSNDWDEIRAVVQGILEQGRDMQQRSRELGGQLDLAQRQAAEAHERIQRLETELEEASQKLQEDPLTGALNRRGLDLAFTRDAARSLRSQLPLSVALLDLDHFKRINDQYGHDLGDEVLRSLVQLTRRLMRPSDSIARMGGEEFMLLLPDVDAEQAFRVVDRLLEAFCAQRTPHRPTGQSVRASFSGGIAQWGQHEDFLKLYQRADVALLQAKQAGRQRLAHAEPFGSDDRS